MGNLKLACVFIMCMALLYAQNGDAITCTQISSNLAPCIDYFMNGGAVSPSCCNGVRRIASAARTTTDRRVACNCLKSAGAACKRIHQIYAAALPGKCGVNIPYKISPSTNCSSIK